MVETDDESMTEEDFQGNPKRLTKKEREEEVSDVLKDIENGKLECYRSSGVSVAWTKFLKIRNSESKERIDYAQCMECKVLLTYKGHGGTSHMNRHVCKMNDPTSETLPFRKLPADKVDEFQNILIRKVIKFCADDLSSYEAICDSANFIDLLQSFVSMGQNLGNVELKPIFPKAITVRQEIADLKNEKEREIYSKFREAYKKEWCSASLQVQRIRSGASEKKLLVMRIQYLESDLSALTNKVIFATSFDEVDTPELFFEKLIKCFNNFGGHKQDLLALKTVTSYESIISNGLDGKHFYRKDCIPEMITRILDEAFDLSPKSETMEFLSTCSSIVRIIHESEKYNLKLILDDFTWKNKFLMVKSINEQLSDVTKILKNYTQISLQFNKTRAEEFMRFMEPFIEASDDLSGVSYPTANKVILWWTVIESHLKEASQYSYEIKHIMCNAMDVFRNKFPLTMEYKIDCFLDPRYKCLKMLKDLERSEVIAEVGNLLENIVVEQSQPNSAPSTSKAPDAKKRRFADFETKKGDSKALLPRKETKKSKEAKGMESRFKAYESNETDSDQNDELTKYLKLPAMKSSQFQSELDILTKFWKSQHKYLPKLYQLATSRLHTPVCCGCVRQEGSSTTPELSVEALTDLLFIKDKL